MKLKFTIITLLFLVFSIGTAQGQFLKKLGKRAEKAAENTVLRKTDEKVTKETEKAMDTILKGKDKKRKGKRKDQPKNDNPQEPFSEETYEEDNDKNTSESSKPQLWSKYNFVPGDKIIFYDDLVEEESGEFPSRWDIIKGNAENASLDNVNVISLKHGSIIMPLMDTHNYLPEVFTLEFDAYFDVKKNSWRTSYYLDLGQGDHGYHYFGENNKDWITALQIKKDGIQLTMDVKGVRKNFSDTKDELKELGQGAWRHISVAFNKRSLKIFIDEHRVLNIPNLGFRPEMFSIGYWNNYASDDEISGIKNIRLAEGGKKLYDRVIAEGKFVTRGILFDVSSATIKSESAGVINEVAKMMLDHQDLKFKIEGHTDSDGADDYNLSLSSERAEAVKWALVERGIAEDRFETEGKGETAPISDNNTPEGKANNRRVEFVKL